MAEHNDAAREIEFNINSDNYTVCPVCKTGNLIFADQRVNNMGMLIGGWNVWCQKCDVYEIMEHRPKLHSWSTRFKELGYGDLDGGHDCKPAPPTE